MKYGGKYPPYTVCGIFAITVHIVSTRNGKLLRRGLYGCMAACVYPAIH